MSDSGADQSPIPPKLDLRQRGVLNNAQDVSPEAPEDTRAASVAEPAAKQPDVPAEAAVGTTPEASPETGTAPAPPAKPDAPARETTTIKLQTPPPSGPATPETIRIKPGAPPPAAAPAPTPAKPVAAAKPIAQQLTETIKLQPPPSPDTLPASEQKTMLAKKKETSKIPLDAATSMAGDIASRGQTTVGVAPRTVRIKPGAGSTVRVGTPPAAGVPTGVPGGAPAGDQKRKTSRISLEAAIVPGGEQAQGTPKTIRLKRPSGTSGAKVAPAGGASPGRLMSKTARLDTASVAGAGGATTPTRKKTIRVKRPTERTAIRAAGPAVAQAGHMPMVQMPGQAPADEPNVLFPLFAIAGILVIAVLVYAQCAQAFGPDSSLTPYSYAKDGPELSWPGKIPVPRQ